MGPENAILVAQLSQLSKAIRELGGGASETPLGGYVTRLDHTEPYFQEDGKGYLQAGYELTDTTKYDTTAFPFEEILPAWDHEPIWADDLIMPGTSYTAFNPWTWATSDGNKLAFGRPESITFTTDGVNFKTRLLAEAETTGWNAQNEQIRTITDAMFHNNQLYVIANTWYNSTQRLLKLSEDFNKFTEIPNGGSVSRFKKTNGRVLALGMTVFFDLTNPEQEVRYTSGSFVDVTFWNGKWWFATSTGVKSGVEPSGTLDTVVSGAHALVAASGDSILVATSTVISYSTDGTNWNPATAPESASIGTASCNEHNGKLFIRTSYANSTTINATQNLICYDFATKSWKEVFPPTGMVVLSSNAMPVWFGNQWWVFGAYGTVNNYVRSPDLDTWSGDEVDSRAAVGFVSTDARKYLIASIRDGNKILQVYSRHIAYSIDGGVTYRTVLAPWKSAGFLPTCSMRIFVEAGEFFIYSTRGHWSTTDFENWTTLPTDFLMDGTSGLDGRTITRLSNGVWISHSNYSGGVTYYSTDRGRSWTVCSVSGVVGAYYDSTRSKFCLVKSGGVVWVGSSLSSMAQTNTATLNGAGSSILAIRHDPATDCVMYFPIGTNTICAFSGDRPHTTTAYDVATKSITTPLEYWTGGPNSIELVGGALYAVSPIVQRFGDRSYFRAVKLGTNRSLEEQQWILPVGNLELPSYSAGGGYPSNVVPNVNVFTLRLDDGAVVAGKRQFCVANHWLALDLTTGVITAQNKPSESLRKVGRVVRTNPLYRSKVATDLKGNAAFVAHQTLYYSAEGGPFLPILDGTIHNVQFADGVWCITALTYDSRSELNGTLSSSLLVALSADLENWYCQNFYDQTKCFVDFVWALGAWRLMSASSLIGMSGTSNKLDSWFNGAIQNKAYLFRDGKLVLTESGSVFPAGNASHSVFISPAYGVVIGFEIQSYDHGDYINRFQGKDADSTGWTHECGSIEPKIRPSQSIGIPDGVELVLKRQWHNDTAFGGQFTSKGIAQFPRGSQYKNILGVNLPSLATAVGSITNRGWIDWGKHRYVFIRSNTFISVYAGPHSIRNYLQWGTGAADSYLSITTGELGQLYIMTARGGLIRGKRGLIAPPIPTKNLTSNYMRVL